MSRPKTKWDAKAQTFRFSKEICDRLEAYHNTSRVPKTAIIEMALAEYLDRKEGKQQ